VAPCPESVGCFLSGVERAREEDPHRSDLEERPAGFREQFFARGPAEGSGFVEVAYTVVAPDVEARAAIGRERGSFKQDVSIG
jgi:hypothetical protein